MNSALGRRGGGVLLVRKVGGVGGPPPPGAPGGGRTGRKAYGKQWRKISPHSKDPLRTAF